MAEDARDVLGIYSTEDLVRELCRRTNIEFLLAISFVDGTVDEDTVFCAGRWSGDSDELLDAITDYASTAEPDDGESSFEEDTETNGEGAG